MIVLIMGVSGVGKTTLGQALAGALGWPFLDADDYHSPENVAKMTAGVPLEDADRWPWLDRLSEVLRQQADAVLACSALKEAYRQRLAQGIADFRVVCLQGDVALIRARLENRQHRYMPASLLDSQLATLESPAGAIHVDVSAPLETCRAAVLGAIRQHW